MHCPKCSNYTCMDSIRGVEIDLCPGCRGIWLDRDELSCLVGTDKDLKPAGTEMKVTSLSCPRCSQTLMQVPYTWERRILVDLCASCEGVWLDSGELEKITAALTALQERFPSPRLQKLQRQNRCKEALSSLYHVERPAAKAPAAGRAAFLAKVYGLLVATLAVSAIGAAVGIQIEAARHHWLWVLGLFATLFLALFVRKVPVLNVVVLFGFGFIDGITLAGALAHYLNADKGGLVLQAFLITAGIFLGLSSYVWITKKDLTGWGPFLYSTLLSLVLSGLVMLVFSTPLTWMIWTWVSAVTFTGYVLHDTSRILLKDEVDEYVVACLDLYLDIVNLFLDILRILSEFEV